MLSLPIVEVQGARISPKQITDFVDGINREADTAMLACTGIEEVSRKIDGKRSVDQYFVTVDGIDLELRPLARRRRDCLPWQA